MQILSTQRDSLFSSWNPHFTPPWLSKRLCSHIPINFEGSIIDPACGAGNLLGAAAIRTHAATREPNELEFLGADTSIRAVRDCKSLLRDLLPRGNYRVQRADFLRIAPTLKLQASTVVMNPPFSGYGLLSKTVRKRISNLEMKGRFNLGYAFVQRAIVEYRPRCLVSLLPSNWIHSRNSAFRLELDALNGRWEWEDIGDNAFHNIDAHLGILLWRPDRNRKSKGEGVGEKVSPSLGSLEVRQGVATGRDALFIRIAQDPPPFGRRMLAARGRDVGRKTDIKIWVPPKYLSSQMRAEFRTLVPRKILDGLRSRSCVTTKRRYAFEYHESMPTWFSGEPKILLPEIVTGKVRIELDGAGSIIPLHSAIAIRVASIREGRKLKRFLESSRIQKRLLERGPRLSGGSARLQVGAIRDVLAIWKRFLKREERNSTL